MGILHSNEFIFFIIVLGGFTFGELFKKINLPDITGQILFGLLLGPTGALLFSSLLGKSIHPIVQHGTMESISFIGDIALGLMVFTIGSHLTKHSLHNAGSRIVKLALTHSISLFAIVTLSLFFGAKLSLINSALLGAISVAVAPGTVISVIQKKHARGAFTKTLLGVVAISNVATIILFDIVHSISITYLDRDIETSMLVVVLTALLKPIITILWGIVSGLLAVKLTKHMHDRNELATIISLVVIGNIVLGNAVHLSPLLINLITGVTYSNKSYHVKRVLNFFNELEGILYSFFFTMAGVHLDITAISEAGIAGAIFIIVRIIAQWLNSYIISQKNGFSAAIGKYLGLAMIPKAGLAVGLLAIITSESEFNDSIQILTAIILSSVVVNELIGPFAVSFSLKKAGDVNQAQPRLIDFLHEEFILMPLKTDNKWDAITTMCKFLIDSNNVHTISVEELTDIVIKREREFPTAIGEQIAVPHARIPGNHKLMGVIGILEKPIDFEALDNQPVDIVILVATPEGKDNLHLRLLATIAKIFSDPILHQRIVNSESPAEVYDILQSREIRTINTYLEED